MEEWGELEMIWMPETEAARVRRPSRSLGSLAIVSVTMTGLGAAASLSCDRPHTSSLEYREHFVTLQSWRLCNTQPR